MRPSRTELLAAYNAALTAVDPRARVADTITLDDSVLSVGEHRLFGVEPKDVVVVAIGKAATAMALGAYDSTGAERGLVVTTHRQPAPYRVCVGSHPVPDEASRDCGAELTSFVRGTQPSDVVVFLLSGGGSAVATMPVEGVTTADVAEMNSLLVSSRLPIEDINEVRAAVSQLKGGRLAAVARAERQVTVVISDVVGAGPRHVASGPTIGFGLGSRARAVLETSGLSSEMPQAVLEAVDAVTLPVRPGNILSTTVGSPSIAAHAAADQLREAGFAAEVVSTTLTGNTREQAISLVSTTAPGTVSVAAGETTLEVIGSGIGGRNQEAALAVAERFETEDVRFAALGTDGIDGPTNAAGAIVDGTTKQRAVELGIDLIAALGNNDSNTALAAVGDTVEVGPTGTNVADLWIAARGSF